MKKFVLAALAASAFGAVPAAAATFIVTPVNAPIAVPTVNNFKADLAGLGYTQESVGALVSVSGPARILFEFMGSESLFRDTFNFPGLPSFTETTTFQNRFVSPIFLGYTTVAAGALQVLFTSNGSGSRTATPGQTGFAVFLPRAGVSAPANVLYFGYDDKAQLDDNHDDFIVRATLSAVPEPATWAMMIGGLGLVGATVRRGRGVKAVTA